MPSLLHFIDLVYEVFIGLFKVLLEIINELFLGSRKLFFNMIESKDKNGRFICSYSLFFHYERAI